MKFKSRALPQILIWKLLENFFDQDPFLSASAAGFSFLHEIKHRCSVRKATVLKLCMFLKALTKPLKKIFVELSSNKVSD